MREKNWYANGVIVQQKSAIHYQAKNFEYWGINAFHTNPLLSIRDKRAQSLSERAMSKKVGEDAYVSLEFISDPGLYKVYVDMCLKLQIPIRVLFLESDYPYERWKGILPERNWIGYEYCPIPLDEQIISDLDWYQGLSKYWKRLNSQGLFPSYREAVDFKRNYELAYKKGEIGDGEYSGHIFRVFEVGLDYCVKGN